MIIYLLIRKIRSYLDTPIPIGIKYNFSLNLFSLRFIFRPTDRSIALGQPHESFISAHRLCY